MQPLDGLTRRPASRYVWGLLTLVFAGLLFGAHLGQERALTSEGNHLRPFANNVLETLTPADVAGPVAAAARQALTATFQAQVFSRDPAVTAAFIWMTDGTLIWSSDRAGRSVGGRSADGAALAAAAGGTTVTLRSTAPALFKTYVPLRVSGRPASLGAIEIDRSAGTDLWRPLQIAFFVLAASCLVLFALSLRRPLGAVEGSERHRRSTASGRSSSGARSPAEAELRRIRDALIEERELRKQAEETYGFLERKLREVESSQVASGRATPERAAGLEESLRAAEARGSNAEARAAEAEARAADAEKRATIAESRFSETVTRAEELETRAARAETRASEDEAEIGRLRDAETATSEQIERLQDAEAETAAQIERLRHDLDEARERTRQGVETYSFLEGRLRQAEERVAATMAQGAGAESRLAEFEAALHAAEERAAQAETELGRLREAEAEAEKLRRELLQEKESGRGLLDEEELARLNDRMEAAERRAVQADRRLRELATMARAAEAVRVPEAQERREPSPGTTAPAKPGAGTPVPAPTKPQTGMPAPVPAKPAPVPAERGAGPPEGAKLDPEDDLDVPEPELPRHARNLRQRLTRTAKLKKLGHKDEDDT
jgi:hypothetical protein